MSKRKKDRLWQAAAGACEAFELLLDRLDDGPESATTEAREALSDLRDAVVEARR